MSNKDIVLAFSGGLDTSFCVPYLQERGWAVHTVFADTGGVDADERHFIEQRAAEDESEPMAALGLVHVVRRDEHRRALRRELVDLIPEIAA